MKKLIVTTCLISCCFFSCKVEQKKRGELNLQNVKLLEIGMDTLKVKKIMGQPETKWMFKGEYSSGQLTLAFDSTGKLISKEIFRLNNLISIVVCLIFMKKCASYMLARL